MYREWQVLTGAESRDETLFGREGKLYHEWLAAQPSAVERREYPTPRTLLRRPTEALAGTDARVEGDEDQVAAINCLCPVGIAGQADQHQVSLAPRSMANLVRPETRVLSEGHATEEIAERPGLRDPVDGARINDSARPPGRTGRNPGLGDDK
ncbi:hypothetical protein PF005_g28610 [Phytophthora fragariae]|uniref:Uncharacterized protein n=1 Tax=Phytophthora fragariae TaxID=53985 RepID=A0A6A3QMI6_9STRA|nr:hypothetical protein PF003_g17805 [Phytophthora fragariae]KAE8921004.1 hypothetical protein PF009_g28709 [Phytophthora fragariae]KAE9063056.1 hypothetical protein PF007_g29684 [Phytophthora fragariae]KAE9067255.1 hypothetical protein PF010_g27536 [Phytophthora fragariae]KAE9078201.1 hypothetical protein PF006_g27762 [Phytophthora fragariae]